MALNFDIVQLVVRAGVLSCIAWALASCGPLVETVPEFEPDHNEPKLVVHAYLSPKDTLVRVYVTQSNPMFSETDRPAESAIVTNATVLLADGVKEAALLYDSTTLSYSVSAYKIGGIRPGATYRLRVSDNKRSAEAKTTIPPAPPVIVSYRLDTSYGSPGSYYGRKDTTLTVQFTWRDQSGPGGYYRVAGKAFLLTDYWEEGPGGRPVVRRGRATIPLQWDNTFGGSELQSDVGSDGEIMHSPIGRVSLKRPVFWTENGTEPGRPVEVRSITLDLLQTDENYYRYHQSAKAQDIAGDNPFAEPVLLYTNVKGGLGIFASYNSFSLDIKPG